MTDKPAYLPRILQDVLARAASHAATSANFTSSERAMLESFSQSLSDGTSFLLETSSPRPTPTIWLYGCHDPMEGFPQAIPADQTAHSWEDAVEGLLEMMTAEALLAMIREANTARKRQVT